MKRLFLLGAVLSLAACNSVYYKPNSVDTTQVFYADRGGFSMKRSIKNLMRHRGYTVVVGAAESSRGITSDSTSIEIDSAVVPDDARYIIKVSERREKFNPIWCLFNGFWWWNFNVSIADQKTGEEIMLWRGRMCQNSAMRILDDTLNKMEATDAENE